MCMCVCVCVCVRVFVYEQEAVEREMDHFQCNIVNIKERLNERDNIKSNEMVAWDCVLDDVNRFYRGRSVGKSRKKKGGIA